MSFSQTSGSPHHFLAQLTGNWSGRSRTWIEPNSDGIEAPLQGSIQLVLDGRFALYLYQSSLDGEPQQGIFTFGYNTTLERYEAGWMDSFHNNTAQMFCTGNPKDNGFWVLGSYPDPTGGPDWGWRTEVELLDPDHLTISAYNVSPEGSESKAFETALTRLRS